MTGEQHVRLDAVLEMVVDGGSSSGPLISIWNMMQVEMLGTEDPLEQSEPSAGD